MTPNHQDPEESIEEYTFELPEELTHTTAALRKAFREFARATAAARKDYGTFTPETLTNLSRTYYATQTHRIKAGNRIKMNVRDNLLTARDAGLLNAHLDIAMRMFEDSIKEEMAAVLEDVPMWTEWFVHLRGIGAVLAGGIIGEISDISRFKYMSNLWSWAGYGIHDGKADRLTKGKKAHWNPNMKVLGWKVGQQFIKQGGWFREQYDQFKIEERAKNTGWVVELNPVNMIGFKVWTEDSDGKNITKENVKAIIKSVDDDHLRIHRSDGHTNTRASRRNIKLFLGLTFMRWRELEGLPVLQPYAGGMVGHTIVSPKEVIAAEENWKLTHKRVLKARAEPKDE